MHQLRFFLLIFAFTLASTANHYPFSDQGGCTSKPTGLDRVRHSCNGELVWPRRGEEPSKTYSILTDTVRVEPPLHCRGDGSCCGEPYYEYTQIAPGRYAAIKVFVPFNTRGTNVYGTRGKVECRVSGRYVADDYYVQQEDQNHQDLLSKCENSRECSCTFSNVCCPYGCGCDCIWGAFAKCQCWGNTEIEEEIEKLTGLLEREFKLETTPGDKE